MPRRSSKDGSSDKSSSRRSSSDGAGSRRSSKEDGGAAGIAGPDELHAASEHHPDRRTGLIWSVNDDHGARLHSVPANARPLKNCMKVSSLEESLRIADENDKRRKEKRRAEGRTGNFSVIRHMSSRGAGSDKNASGGNGPLKSTRNLIRHMSSRGNDAANNGGGGNSGGGGFGGFIARGLRSFGGSAKGKDKLDTVSEASSSPKQGSRKKKRAVKFSTLRFRWYDLRADDNPGVSKGPALGIGWKYEEDESDTPVDVHEQYRTSTAPRRRLKEIKLSEQERERRLLESGVTISEIQKMRKQINLAKGRRRRTIEEGLTNMESEERKERVLHKIKKMLKMRKKYEKEEEDLWDKAQEKDDAPKVMAQ